MRMAIFHDFLDQKGGGEKLVLELAEKFNADIITSAFDETIANEMGFSQQKIIVIPGSIHKGVLRDLSTALAFSNCNFSKDYDFFIFSGSLSLFASAKHSSGFFYCHEIPKGKLFKPFFKKFLEKIRVISNSERTRKRLLREFNVDSNIINPPIRTSEFFSGKNNGYWLSVNRLHEQKRIELQLDTFRLLPGKKLVIVSDNPERLNSSSYKNFLMKRKPENVEFLFGATKQNLLNLYANCEGFIATSQDEPFGMAVVEALASGKPVVCVNEGGFTETIIEGKTGFFAKPDPSDICVVVKKISRNPDKYRNACIARAKEFSQENFFGKISEFIV